MDYPEETIRQLLYRKFDQEGIKVRPIASIRISFNPETSGVYDEDKFTFVPVDKEFNLTNEDYCELIVDYIFDTTGVNIGSIDNLNNFASLNNLPFLLQLDDYPQNMVFSLAFGKIPGSIRIREEHKIYSLGNIVEINGSLGLTGGGLQSFGRLKKVSGSLWMTYADPNTTLTDLNEIEEIGGSLLLRYYPLKNLNRLKSVGGILNLRSTNIESLGSLKFVGEHVYLPKEKEGIIDLSGIDIGGKVKYFRT